MVLNPKGIVERILGQPKAMSDGLPEPLFKHQVSEADTALRIRAVSVPHRPVQVMTAPAFDIGTISSSGDLLVRGLAAGDYRLFLRVAEGHICDARFPVRTGGPGFIDLSDVLQGANDAGLPFPERPVAAYLEKSKELKAQFWVAALADAESFQGLFSEEAYYALKEEEQDAGAPLSLFAESQGQRWYDHDFLEIRALSPAEQRREAPISMSWSSTWEVELRKRVEALGETDFDGIVMMNVEQSTQGSRRIIRAPKDAKIGNARLTYLREITFRSF